MGYQLFQPAIAPGFLRGSYGTAYNAALGLIKDWFADTVKQGVQQRFAAQAQAGGLAAIGQERGIPQGLNETTHPYVQSLINAWTEWQLAGNPWSILGLLNFLGYGNVYLITQNGNVWGPSSAVVLPNPTAGIVGVPPSLSSGNPWTFAVGSGPAGFQGYPSTIAGYWEPSTSYANATISPNPPNGLLYSMTGTHTSGSSAPSWPVVVGNTVSDGGITWTCIGGADQSPVGQTQGYVSTSFWSEYLLVFSPLPTSWTSVVNPPTVSSDPSLYELSAIYTLLTKFNAGHSICGGLLVAPTSATRATFGWPNGRTFYGDCGMAAASGSSDGLTKYWLPRTVYAAGSQIVPNIAGVPNGYYYRTTAGGTSGNTHPVWPTTPTDTVSDGTVTWICEAATQNYLAGTSQAVTTFAFVPSTPI